MTEAGPTIPCVGCGGLVPKMDGPTHRYMESSPGCWHLYGELLAHHYSDPSFAPLHRLAADCYAVQHPGRPSPQSIQSVCIHLISLCLVVERSSPAAYFERIMDEVIRSKSQFFWLTPPQSPGAVTVADVAKSVGQPRYEELVRAWAASAWSAWADHHGTVREWIPE